MKNRETQFRGWCPKDRKMYEWHEIRIESYGVYIISLKDWDGDIVLMQYTGLKDKNSKEIYEGDILQETTSQGIVMFGEYTWDYVSERGKRNEKRYGYYLKMIPQEGWRISVGFTKPLEMAADWKVIGNVYENKELLNLDKEE